MKTYLTNLCLHFFNSRSRIDVKTAKANWLLRWSKSSSLSHKGLNYCRILSSSHLWQPFTRARPTTPSFGRQLGTIFTMSQHESLVSIQVHCFTMLIPGCNVSSPTHKHTNGLIGRFLLHRHWLVVHNASFKIELNFQLKRWADQLVLIH